MSFRQPFAPGEWYHCFSRGVDKRITFKTAKDYERFLTLLYLCNGTNKIQISDRRDTSMQSLLSDTGIEKGEPLVTIGVYALMPNHVHLVLREATENGISEFLQRVFTGYTMYFNRRYRRTGGLFAGPFKSKHVLDDLYLKKLLAYVMLNPAELFDLRWKTGLGSVEGIEKKLLDYPYSSLPDFFGIKRLQSKVISEKWDDYYDRKLTLRDLVRDAKAYYKEHPEA